MLSIVVPFYNEDKNIPLVLEEFKKLSATYSEFELLCVNDGSKDETASIFKKLDEARAYPFAKFISYSPNQGYGNAIMTGVGAAAGEVIAWTHSDMQTHPADIFRALEVFKRANNLKLIVKGKRVNRALPQVLFGYGMAVIASAVLGKIFTEINAQPKLFHKDFVKFLDNAPKDFSLDLFMLYRAKQHGYEIVDIKVRFPERVHGQSSWAFSWQSKLKTINRTIKYIWRLKKEV